jgi:hypothetical protein
MGDSIGWATLGGDVVRRLKVEGKLKLQYPSRTEDPGSKHRKIEGRNPKAETLRNPEPRTRRSRGSVFFRTSVFGLRLLPLYANFHGER